MNYLTVAEVVQLHDWLIDLHGGSRGVIDPGLIDSAVFQPQATFAGHELNPTLADKAAALGFSLVKNHAFADGNKRVAQAATSASRRRQWRRFWCGTASRSRPVSTTKRPSSWRSRPATSTRLSSPTGFAPTWFRW